MPRTLYTKLALGLLILLVAIGAAWSAISLTLADNYNRRVSQDMNRHLAANIVADRKMVQQGRLDEKAMQETFMAYMKVNPSIEIYLLDKAGKILAYSAEPGKVKAETVSLGPVNAFLEQGNSDFLLGDDPRNPDRQKAFSATRIPGEDGQGGYLYVVLRGELYDAAAGASRGSYLMEMGGWAMAISLGAGLLIGLVVFRLLTRRLRDLSTRVEEFAAQGEPAEPVALLGLSDGDELETLSQTFDQMAERISDQIQELKERDALRRRLVAQVSHDLRTPLASMQGYLESMQIKGKSLSEEERADFLAISLRQGRKLEKMLEELFQLASLEARENLPQLEPFSLSELVYDAVEKHRMKAENEHVSLGLDVGHGTPMAFGDVGLTERVLDNLLNNAIQHTPESGHVDISASTEDGLITVSVTDNGPGIEEKDMNHVFEPFYRGGNTVQTAHNAGLGLAIAKRIMDLQNGSINVARAANGNGSVFSFQLPLHSKAA